MKPHPGLGVMDRYVRATPRSAQPPVVKMFDCSQMGLRRQWGGARCECTLFERPAAAGCRGLAKNEESRKVAPGCVSDLLEAKFRVERGPVDHIAALLHLLAASEARLCESLKRAHITPSRTGAGATLSRQPRQSDPQTEALGA